MTESGNKAQGINTTTAKKIDKILTRGVVSIYPNKEFLKGKLLFGEKITLYLGIDPTAPTLHLGHAIVLKKLKEFQDLGHRIILLIGDFTGMVGDPTGKNTTRGRLSHDEILKNAKNYKKQAATFLSFSGDNKAIIKYNSKWLSKMNFEKVLNLASNMTVEQMLKRDMFDRRIKEGRPIYIHEFLYPLLQGYDSVALGVDGEIGGNDQTFNMLVGRTLAKQLLNKEKFVLTVKLLEDPTGKKMGKTEGNMLTLNDSANEMFGKVMSWPDTMIKDAFELCTDVSDGELEKIAASLKEGTNPKNLKLRLAHDIVSVFYGNVKAKEAEALFTKTFSKKEAPEGVPTIFISNGTALADALKRGGIISSMSEFHRLIKGGAIEEVGGGRVSNSKEKLTRPLTYKIGKHRFLKIVIKNEKPQTGF